MRHYYQGNDNRLGTYVPNGLNQYTHIANQPLGYDGQANLINDGTQVYTYDAENRLLTTSGTTASSFVYDPNGRLFQSTIGGTVTQYVYDGDALIGEYNGSGTLQRRYVHGDQVDEPLVQYNGTAIGASNRRYLHTDHQGSIIAHSDSSGSVFATNGTLAYDAYGIAATKNNSVVGAFGYTGQVYFPSLGLNYYKARFYHPKLGRFLQTDPIGYEDQMNLYAYVGNDPINAIDSTGMNTEILDPTDIIDEVLVTGTRTSCGCGSLTGQAAQDFINAMAKQQNQEMVIALSAAAIVYSVLNENTNEETPKKESKPNISGKEDAKDVPSWAKGERPYVGENGDKFVDRLLGQKYGPGNYPKDPGSEHKKIKMGR